MGIARFYRWLSERYPLINEVVEVDNVPEFDNFYLDMNGIIHNCSHGNTGGQKNASEEHMWLEVFKYVSTLVYKIRPKKLLYLAVDGVAPRAKMNQQRSRRFRAAHDAKEAREKTERMNPSDCKSDPTGFDSNCITPGTEFMERLVHHLEFFVKKKLAEDPIWFGLEVVLSGPEVPGEGEHKIMDYIRSFKSRAGYDNNTRHCLYGLDADLIMLSLASHEPNFALLREEIDFSFSRTPSKESRSMLRPDRFQLLHISILREYLGIEFFGDNFVAQKNFDSVAYERVIDDFVFFCFLVGNDFLPHLPFAEIGEGGLGIFFECYKKLALDASSFLVHENGTINFHTLHRFLSHYIAVERDLVAELVVNSKWKIGETRTCVLKEKSAKTSSPTEWNTVTKPLARPRRPTPQSVEQAMDQFYQVKMGLETPEEKAQLVRHYLAGLQWVFFYYYKGPPSWDWYYPYHYSPFAVDVVAVLGDLLAAGTTPVAEFEEGTPFLPFQQLMAVLPPASGVNFLPKILYDLMVSPASPISQYYPEEFVIDMDGVRVPWGGTALIPFVDEKELIKATNLVFEKLSPGEKHRNSHGTATVFSKTAGAVVVTSAASTLPTLVKDLAACKIFASPFSHAPIGMEIFPHRILPGYRANADFPSLLRFGRVSFSMGSGVKVFNSVSRKESVFIVMDLDESGPIEQVAEKLSRGSFACNFPFFSKPQKPLAVTGVAVKYKISGKKISTDPLGQGKHENDVDWVASKLEETGLMLVSADSLYNQPIVELADGLKYFAALAVPKKSVSVVKKASSSKSLPNSPVLCLAPGPDFGRVFSWASTTWTSDPSPAPAVLSALQSGVQQILLLSQSVQYSRWLDLNEIAAQVGVSADFAWTVFGEVWIRMGKLQEEIGMNLWSYSSTGEPRCVPGYAKYIAQKKRFNRWDAPTRSAWRFSLLAVTALQAYIRDLPEVAADIRETCSSNNESHSFTIQGKRLFERYGKTHTQAWVNEYLLGKIVSYITKQPFKRLSISGYNYESINPEFVTVIDQFVDQFTKQRVEDTISSSLPVIPSPGKSDVIRIGARGVYTKPDGLVALGAWGTVIGLFGDSVDVMVDLPNLNASSLNGYCPESKGIRIPAKEWFVAPELAPADPESLKLRNKIIADLVVGLTKQKAAPPGTKISVEQLFGKKLSEKPKRPPAPVFPPNPEPQAVPAFLVGKIRPAPQ